MRFLLDMPVSVILLDVLITHGHEGIHAYQIGEDRASDIELLENAPGSVGKLNLCCR